MYVHDDSASDLWDYKFPQQRYIPDDSTIAFINNKYGGNQMRELVRTEWTGSSFFVYFKMGDKVKRVNITNECRTYCKEHNKRFTIKVREQLSETMPKSLEIWLKLTDYYQQHCPYNIGGVRYLTSANEKMLRETWLSKLKF